MFRFKFRNSIFSYHFEELFGTITVKHKHNSQTAGCSHLFIGQSMTKLYNQILTN